MTSMNEPSAVGVFDNLDTAERTIKELKRAGFRADEIGIIGHVGTESVVPIPPELNYPEENAISSFLKGTILGGIIGIFVILVIPGLGEVAGLGLGFEILGGAIFGGVAGGVLIAFGSLFFSRPNTQFYAEELQKGHFIVTVKNPQRKDEADSVLRRQGIFAEKTSS